MAQNVASAPDTILTPFMVTYLTYSDKVRARGKILNDTS